MDLSLIRFDLDLRDYFQRRIIQNDENSLIVPKNEPIRPIGKDVIQNPKGAQENAFVPVIIIYLQFSQHQILDQNKLSSDNPLVAKQN